MLAFHPDEHLNHGRAYAFTKWSYLIIVNMIELAVTITAMRVSDKMAM